MDLLRATVRQKFSRLLKITWNFLAAAHECKIARRSISVPCSNRIVSRSNADIKSVASFLLPQRFDQQLADKRDILATIYRAD
jgi:hypothetical protein